MSSVLVDSNVLIDLITEDSVWFSWSRETVRRVATRQHLITNPIIYAEVSVLFSHVEELDAVLAAVPVAREPLPYEAAFLAGKAFLDYRRRGGLRRSPMPDFYIGAHAAVTGHYLLTRDAARYRTYFPDLSLIAPD